MRTMISMMCAICLMTLVCGRPARAADAKTPEQLAAAGMWAEAIESYGDDLRRIPADEYRDKKDFSWVLEEYEKQSPGKYDVLTKVANDLLAKHKKDDMFTWRLHRLLAEIAEKTKADAAMKKELDAAIAAYPAKIEGNPMQHSSLQHLYNQRAMLDAKTDVKAAEDFILKAFGEDQRFLYFFSNPWMQLYEEKQQPEKFAQLMERVVKIYPEKARKDAKQRPMLERYATLLRNELAKK